MSSFNRRTIVFGLAALPLAGCGFQPIYQTGAVARGAQGQIRFNLIESREGFLMLQELEARLGTPVASAPFSGQVEFAIEDKELVIVAATQLARHELRAKATVVIKDAATGAEVYSGEVRETAGYSSNSETGATAAARKDARDRLIIALAEKISLMVAASSESWAS